MGKKPFLSLLLCCLSLSYSFARVSSFSDLMVEDARQNLQKSIKATAGNKKMPEGIYESVFQKANACPNNECAYESYVSGLYDFVDYLGVNRKCPISLKRLSGEWVNSSKWGNYEKISLSLYKGRPSVHQFIVFKSQKSSDLEDGFGGWRFNACKVKTIERTSSGGRMFTPGNELIVLSYDQQSKVLVVLDGDYVVGYVKSN